MEPPSQFYTCIAQCLQVLFITAVSFALPRVAQSQFSNERNSNQNKQRKPQTMRNSPIENRDPDCLNPNNPKPKIISEKGLLNGYAIKLPLPRYPAEAIKAGVEGDVTVEIAVNLLTGAIDWARFTSGHPLLQTAVQEVVCKVRFSPTNDIPQWCVGGFLKYHFDLRPRKGKQKKTRHRSR